MSGSVIVYIFSQGCLMFFSGVWSQTLYKVTYPSKNICTIKGSSVILRCLYNPGPHGTQTRHWFRERDKNGVPKDLTYEQEYARRIWMPYSEDTCDLQISALRGSDSGVYYFRFKAWASSYGQTSAWFHGSKGVALTVSDVQLKVDLAVAQRRIILTCATSCSLGTSAFYEWYRNRQYLLSTKEASIDIASGSESEGRYHCLVSVNGYQLTSAAVCVLGPECWGVTYPTESICGLKGSTVVLSCSYKYPGGHQFEQGHWYRVSGSPEEPEDLSQDPSFRGRVQISASNCSLVIRDLKASDSGVYRYTFRTVTSEWMTAQTGISLSVTELQVTVDPHSVETRWIKAFCSNSCRRSTQLRYYWYRNGQPLDRKHGLDIDIYYRGYEGLYSCSIQGYQNHPSPAVCILAKECWGVTYATEAMCALMGSSVDVTCHYKHPAGHLPMSQSWFHDVRHPNKKHGDLTLSHDSGGRVEYRGNNSVHTLRLSNLSTADTGEYYFSFKTDKSGEFIEKPGVMLSITSLRVTVSSAVVTEGDNVTLTCNTTCPLSNDPTFTWYKNSRPVSTTYITDKERLYLNPVNSADSGLYTCAVTGQESYPSTAEILNIRYPPKETFVSESPSGETEKGQAVVLSCSSQANPSPHTYSWYKRSGPEGVLKKVSEEVNMTVTSDDEGLYHCEAHNEIGSENSSVIEVCFAGGLERKELLGVGAIILAAILFFGLFLSLFWRRNRQPSENNESAENNTQADAAPVYGNISVMAVTADPANPDDDEDDDDEIEYTSVQFSDSDIQGKYGYSTVHKPRNRPSTVRRIEDYSVVYSVVSSPRLYLKYNK